MSTQAGTNGIATAAEIHPSPEVVNAILKWSEEDRRDLAMLLMDSIRRGFTSLEEAEAQDRNLIRERLELLTSGKAKLIDANEMFAAIDRRLAEIRKK
jgi:hypothetical protein